ncbi:hypothetical protein ACJIZ3_012011 [Penstemon smallii]|uniref:NAC domain-containing protein n=1 Tax=Penstemon smallii TaxID=265156 RepID=A0ABD3UKS7_9LAMI
MDPEINTQINTSYDLNQIIVPGPGNAIILDYEKVYIKVFPPGYRFKPRDDELILDYLKKKISNEPIPYSNINIHEENIYNYNPDHLSLTFCGEKEWYFFTPRDRKYQNGKRPNRAAGTGFWKATGGDIEVLHHDEVVGFKKSLVFYDGKPPNGVKSNWIMHEFTVNIDSNTKRKSTTGMRLDEWVLCRIHQNTHGSKRRQTNDGDGNPKEKSRVISKGMINYNNNISNQESTSNGLMNRLGIIDFPPTINAQVPQQIANLPPQFEGVNEDVMPLNVYPVENDEDVYESCIKN